MIRFVYVQVQADLEAAQVSHTVAHGAAVAEGLAADTLLVEDSAVAENLVEVVAGMLAVVLLVDRRSSHRGVSYRSNRRGSLGVGFSRRKHCGKRGSYPLVCPPSSPFLVHRQATPSSSS
jgi:hypothetical protein